VPRLWPLEDLGAQVSGRWSWRSAGTQEAPRTELLRDGQVAGELTFIVKGHHPYPGVFNDHVVRGLNRGVTICDEWAQADVDAERAQEDAEL